MKEKQGWMHSWGLVFESQNVPLKSATHSINEDYNWEAKFSETKSNDRKEFVCMKNWHNSDLCLWSCM